MSHNFMSVITFEVRHPYAEEQAGILTIFREEKTKTERFPTMPRDRRQTQHGLPRFWVLEKQGLN